MWAGAVLAGAGLVAAGCSYQLPSLAVSPAARPRSSVILAADGHQIATVHGPVNRQPVPLSAIPLILQKAVVATEDRGFWTEPAVDLGAVARAALADARTGRPEQGGSTIAEQYVKTELSPAGAPRTLAEKIREATLAYELERRYSRAQVLDMYLNAVYLGSGSYGVEAASETYFGRPVGQLDLAQAALLAGLIQAPSGDDPLTDPAAAARRRREVLDSLVSLGIVSPQAARAAGSAPLVETGPDSPSSYPAPYFVSDVEAFILSNRAFGPTEQARRHALYDGGLTIRTTLDLAQQAEAEQAIAHVLPGTASGPAAALVTLDPSTGAVLALVGGEDYFSRRPGSQLDLATQAARQSGSTFKPFVLTAALERGFSLSRLYPAPASISIPITGGTWSVHNYPGEPTGTMNLVSATVVSDNVVYAQLMMQVGPARVVSTAAALGITTPLGAYPSAALGSNAVNPLEMADAYATLIDGGVHHAPLMVTEVDSPTGRVLYRHRPDPRRVVSTQVAYTVDAVLERVVDEGTGVEARIGRPVAGKTGTTDNWNDAWFVGGTPQIVSAVWVGFPQAEKSMVPPTTPILVTGGTWPARIFQLYASVALADQPIVDFPNPPPPAARAIAGPAGVPVDHVVGFPVAVAESELARDGFVAEVRGVPSREYPPGYVVSQTPPGGAAAPGGSTVVLEVSH